MKEIKIGIIQQHNVASREDNIRRLRDGIIEATADKVSEVSEGRFL